MAEEKNIEGLGGWLLLVGLGIILSPGAIIGASLYAYLKIFSSGAWSELTTPGTDDYNPLWAPILSGEMLVNVGLALAWIFIAYLFFSKKKAFPRWFIGISIFTLAFILVDAFAIKLALPNVPVFDPETIKKFVKSLIFALVWVPYMLMSKRVKATFVK